MNAKRVVIGPKQRRAIDRAAADAKVNWRDWSAPGRVMVALYTEAGDSYLGSAMIVAGAVVERGEWEKQDRPKLDSFAGAYTRRAVLAKNES